MMDDAFVRPGRGAEGAISAHIAHMPFAICYAMRPGPRGAEGKARNSEQATITTSRSAVDDGRLRTAQRVHRSGLDAGPETVAGVGVAVCGHLRVLRVPLHALCSGNLAHIAPATAKHTRERARTRADECMRADQCTRGACGDEQRMAVHQGT